jgi:putative hydrolase of the HAD superfamily
MIRALVFDLDDTLYREHDFVAGGFRAVAERLGLASGHRSEDIHQFMMTTLDTAGRREVMPAVLNAFPQSGLEMADVVRIYRTHVPEIRLFVGYEQLLTELRVHYRLGLITDGTPEVQRAKCAALHLADYFHCMVFTWEHGVEREKPHSFSFRLMLDRLDVAPAETLFIGDNYEKDCRGAHGVGMKCIQVRKPTSPDAAEGEHADFLMDSLLQLPVVLKQLGGYDEAA